MRRGGALTVKPGSGDAALAVVLALHCLFHLASVLLHRRADLLRTLLDGDPGGLGVALHGVAGGFGAAGNGRAGFLGISLDNRDRFLGVPFYSGTDIPGILFEGIAAVVRLVILGG